MATLSSVGEERLYPLHPDFSLHPAGLFEFVYRLSRFLRPLACQRRGIVFDLHSYLLAYVCPLPGHLETGRLTMMCAGRMSHASVLRIRLPDVPVPEEKKMKGIRIGAARVRGSSCRRLRSFDSVHFTIDFVKTVKITIYPQCYRNKFFQKTEKRVTFCGSLLFSGNS